MGTTTSPEEGLIGCFPVRTGGMLARTIPFNQVYFTFSSREWRGKVCRSSRICVQCRCSIHILRVDPELLPILSDMFSLLISIQRLPHIKCILPAAFISRSPIGIITIILDHPPEHAVPHSFVHIDGELVAGADVEVNEPGGGLVACSFKRRGEEFGVPEAPIWGGRRSGW